MEDLVQVAEQFQEFCEERTWKFCFIGGMAALHWGQPRLTQDVDLCLNVGFGGEEPYIDAILKEYTGRIEDAREFAVENRVLLIESSAGVPLDVSLGAIPFEVRVVERARRVEYLPGIVLRICSPEDLVILKCFANRLRDWADVEGVLQRRGGELDWALIKQELTELCEFMGSREILQRLLKMRP